MSPEPQSPLPRVEITPQSFPVRLDERGKRSLVDVAQRLDRGRPWWSRMWSVVSALLTFAGFAVALVSLMVARDSVRLAQESLERSHLTASYGVGANSCKEVTGTTLTVGGFLWIFLLTNTGRQAITVVEFPDDNATANKPTHFSWIKLDQPSTKPSNAPFVLQPGEATVVSVSYPSGVGTYPPSAYLSDGQKVGVTQPVHELGLVPPLVTSLGKLTTDRACAAILHP